MVVRRAVGLAGPGVAIGLLASVPVSRSLASLLVDVTPFDLPTLAGMSSRLLAVAVAAAWIPARRAAGTDPLAALRTEQATTARKEDTDACEGITYALDGAGNHGRRPYRRAGRRSV